MLLGGSCELSSRSVVSNCDVAGGVVVSSVSSVVCGGFVSMFSDVGVVVVFWSAQLRLRGLPRIILSICRCVRRSLFSDSCVSVQDAQA